MYRVKEMVYTLQGEGFNAGKAIVLCRFEGCNLSCIFCDTDYRGIDGPEGGEFNSAADLVNAALSCWKGSDGSLPRILCTGGEPLLQLDALLVDELHAAGFEIYLETNGTIKPPEGIDWICVSPKAGADLVLDKGNELKLLFPLNGTDPSKFITLDFDHFYLQPVFGRNTKGNTKKAFEYCLKHPEWTLSLQTHRLIGIP